jgi:hypothetical protein
VTTDLSQKLINSFYATAMPLMAKIFACDAAVLGEIKSTVFDDLKLHEKFEASSPEQQHVIFQHIHYLCELSSAHHAVSNIASKAQDYSDYAELRQSVMKVAKCMCSTMPDSVMSLITMFMPILRSVLATESTPSSENLMQTLMPMMMPVLMQLLQTFQSTQLHPDASACLQEYLPVIQAQGLALVQTKGLAGVLSDFFSIVGFGDASKEFAHESSHKLTEMFGHLLPLAGAGDQTQDAIPAQQQQVAQLDLVRQYIQQKLQQSQPPEVVMKLQNIIAQLSTAQLTPDALAKVMQDLQSLM